MVFTHLSTLIVFISPFHNFRLHGLCIGVMYLTCVCHPCLETAEYVILMLSGEGSSSSVVLHLLFLPSSSKIEMFWIQIFICLQNLCNMGVVSLCRKLGEFILHEDIRHRIQPSPFWLSVHQRCWFTMYAQLSPVHIELRTVTPIPLK